MRRHNYKIGGSPPLVEIPPTQLRQPGHWPSPDKYNKAALSAKVVTAMNIKSFLTRDYLLDALENGGRNSRKWLRAEWITDQVLICLGTAIVVVNVIFAVRVEAKAWVITVAAVFLLLTLGVLARTNSLSRAFLRFSNEICRLNDLREPYVLYLRTFDDDRRLARPQPLPFPLNILRSIFWFGYTEEQLFVHALRSVGPVVAAGRPGQQVPHVGAQRIRLGHDWQDEISVLMRQARLVVLALGPGSATMWELHEAMCIVRPDRLILLVPMERKEYDQIRWEFYSYAKSSSHQSCCGGPPAALPYYTGRQTLPSRIQALVHFSPTREPSFRRLQSYSRIYNSLYVVIRRSLFASDGVIGSTRASTATRVED